MNKFFKKKILCIIPARGGSKRIKNKNIKTFFNQPMIFWPIKIAKDSKIFDQIIVSTDSKKISKIAKKFGAKTPFVRSSKISDDYTNLSEVVIDCINFFNKKGIKYSYYCLIYATNPFTIKEDLIKARKKIFKDNLDFVLTVSKFGFPIQRALKIKKNILKPINRKFINKRSQDLDDFYHETGHFILGKTDSWLKRRHPYFMRSSQIEIPTWRSQDIDTLEDWKKAENLFKILNKRKS